MIPKRDFLLFITLSLYYLIPCENKNYSTEVFKVNMSMIRFSSNSIRKIIT